jgi:hypothetical protein
MLLPLADFISHVADRRTSTVLFSLAMTGIFGSIVVLAERSTYRAGAPRDARTMFQASATGLTAGVVAFVLLAARRERQVILRDELRRMVELNHSLRNSLQIIADAHFNEVDADHRKMMFDTVKSMNCTLQKLFPNSGIDRRNHLLARRIRQLKPLRAQLPVGRAT